MTSFSRRAIFSSLSSSDAPSNGGARDRSLDGIRAIAALWVFATHATYMQLMPSILNFRGAGRAGVVLFFFLSAFLISEPFLRNPEKALSGRAWTTYGLRRLFRIVPLYFVVLLALFCAAIDPFNQPAFNANAELLALHLTFQEGLSLFWTIVVEMRFYVVLPLLMIVSALILKKLRHGRSVLILVGCLWMAGVATGVIQQGWLRHLGIDKHAPVFVAGVLTALLLARSQFELFTPRTSLRGPTKVLFECLAWCSAAVFICLSVPALYNAITQGGSIAAYTETRSPVLEAFWNLRISWIGLVLGVFFVCYRNGTGFMSSLLSWPPLVWIGRVSFGFYLVHLTVLQAFLTSHMPAGVKLILSLMFSIGIASLLFVLLEAPMISLGQRLCARLRPGLRGVYADRGHRQVTPRSAP